jgi:hypothetical protein
VIVVVASAADEIWAVPLPYQLAVAPADRISTTITRSPVAAYWTLTVKDPESGMVVGVEVTRTESPLIGTTTPVVVGVVGVDDVPVEVAAVGAVTGTEPV